MAFVNVVFNSAAIQLLQDNPRVRIRVKDGLVQYRPTTRKSELNLPKGERLRPIVRQKRMTYFSIKEDILEVNTSVIIEETPYGWYTIVGGEIASKTIPGAKLAPASQSAVRRTKEPFKHFEGAAEHASLN